MEGLPTQEIVLVPYPFSDLSASKLRPAIVLANIDRGDFVLCQITSNAFSDPRAVELRSSDLESGALARVSYARPGKLFTGNQKLVRERIGRLNKGAMDRVIEEIVRLLRAGR